MRKANHLHNLRTERDAEGNPSCERDAEVTLSCEASLAHSAYWVNSVLVQSDETNGRIVILLFSPTILSSQYILANWVIKCSYASHKSLRIFQLCIFCSFDLNALFFPVVQWCSRATFHLRLAIRSTSKINVDWKSSEVWMMYWSPIWLHHSLIKSKPYAKKTKFCLSFS